MNLEDYYKKFNFPASSTFLKQLKNEGLKYTKDEVDKFIKGKTEQQQTTIKTEKRKDLGKIVSFYPLSLVQMDIYDLAKYYRDNQGYKYILCLADVYSRKVWAYKMKNKDNDNVFDSFKQFIKDSDLKKYKPTTLMSDHDSTFTNSKFKEILKENEIFQTLNIKDDHHALGLIDSFARTLKKTFTRIFLNNGNSNWIKHLDEVIDNFNSMPNTAIKNIKPDNAFQEKNHRTIYDINYEKSLKNNVESDIHVNDKVRILQKKNQFQKGTEARYSDDVYTVKKVNGKSITLNNDEVYKRTSLLIVPKSTISDEKNVIVKINKQNKEERFLKSEGVEVSNILSTKRTREKVSKTTTK
jgi:hypothetical protein